MRNAIAVSLLLITGIAVGQTPSPRPAKPAPSKPGGTAAKATPTPTPTPAAIAAATSAAKLPSQEQVDAALKRTLGYDANVSWQILDIRSTPIVGVAEVLVSLNKQQPIRLYWSQATQDAVVGELIPFGPNPYVAIRARLQAADGPARGPQQGVITIVDFSDLQCPHCKVAHPILEKLATDFPQVRIVFQQYPLPPAIHPWAMKAAQYADCVGHVDKNAFWKYVGSVYENQASITEATVDDWLKRLATNAGLDAAKISACAATPEADDRVRTSLELGRKLSVNETPSVFINGRLVRGIANLPYDQLKNLVQFEIDHAGK